MVHHTKTWVVWAMASPFTHRSYDDRNMLFTVYVFYCFCAVVACCPNGPQLNNCNGRMRHALRIVINTALAAGC